LFPRDIGGQTRAVNSVGEKMCFYRNIRRLERSHEKDAVLWTDTVVVQAFEEKHGREGQGLIRRL